MATKIRLARHGHKDYAFYHIVVADSRSPRDGKIIERIGSFNPNTNPSTVILNFERALYWVGVGAQPTDTVRTILSGEGVLLMKHRILYFRVCNTHKLQNRVQNYKKYLKNARKICVYQKKAVILQAFSVEWFDIRLAIRREIVNLIY